jgi:hypothetical protein
MSPVSNEDVLTKGTEAWKDFADELPLGYDKVIFVRSLDDRYKYAADNCLYNILEFHKCPKAIYGLKSRIHLETLCHFDV